MAGIKKVSELWDQLPSFVRNQRTVRAEIKNSSEVVDAYASPDEWRDEPIEKANMITSLFNIKGKTELHVPIIDLDYEAKLVPSSTPGHYHLYLNKTMTKDEYMKLLKVMAEVGVIQHGFYEGAKKRGASSVRLPWIKKGDKDANAMEPGLAEKRIKAAIDFHKRILSDLQAKLNATSNPAANIGLIADPVPGKLHVGVITKADVDNDWTVIGKTDEPIKFEPLDKDVEW